MVLIDNIASSGIGLSDLSEEFYNYANRCLQSPLTGPNDLQEIEMSFHRPSFEVLSIIFNYPGAEAQTELEVKFKISSTEKVRIRKKLSEFHSTIQNKSNIINLLKNQKWVKKTHVDVTNVYSSSMSEKDKVKDKDKWLFQF